MMRSLFSGISGLSNHQTRMDVIGNNIANVNTAGFKQSRVIFQDIFSQTASGGTANGLAFGAGGGVNPMQIGLGIRTSSIDVLHTRGAFQRTDNPTDLMINGDGMFVVGSPILDDDGLVVGFDTQFTRAGNFYIDNEGYLVTSGGLFVLGWSRGPVFTPDAPPEDRITWMNGDELQDFMDDVMEAIEDPDADGVLQLTKISLRVREDWPVNHSDPANLEPFMDLVGFNVGENGELQVMINNRIEVMGVLAVAMFSNVAGLLRAGNSLYDVGAASGNPVIGMANQNGAGEIMAGGLEMSNVDLATQFTDMIVTQRGFQANSRIITVSDSMLEELVNLKR